VEKSKKMDGTFHPFFNAEKIKTPTLLSGMKRFVLSAGFKQCTEALRS
jgi:hypothetical protein